MKICSVLPHLQNCGDETSDQPWVEAREPPWSEAQDKHGCPALWLYANASPAFSTRNSSVSQHLTHALGSSWLSLHLCSCTAFVVVSRLWNRYSVLQAHSKVHHIPSLLSIQGAFWPRKPIVLFSKTFSQLFRRMWIPSWCPYSIYFKSASFPRYLGKTISPSSTTVLPLTRHP